MANNKSEQFLTKAREVHGDVFDYSQVEYVNNREKVSILCKKHGAFNQRPYSHLQGAGCKKCSIDRLWEGRRSTNEDFSLRLFRIFGDLYSYDKIDYRTLNEDVVVTCRAHGDFQKPPSSLLRGVGCPLCSKAKLRDRFSLTAQDFVDKSIAIHGNRYDYSLVEYKNAKEKVVVGCDIHGPFDISPSNHIWNKRGCPSCYRSNTREEEWLDSLKVPIRQHTIHLSDGCWVIVDGYCPKSKTVYEFWGDYFHGNPALYDPAEKTFFGKSFGELYTNTMKKRQKIIADGYLLEEVWEFDWKNGQ